MAISEFLVLVLLVAGLVILGTLIIIAAKNEKKEKINQTDYRSLFVLGICFFPVGIALWLALDNAGFIGISAMGFIYLITGFSHRKEWME